jgi:hypothetical protein
MTKFQVFQYCIQRLNANWPHTAIQNENTPFDSKSVDEYIRFTVFYDDEENFSHGNPPKKKLYGSIGCEVFVRYGIGPGRMLQLVDLFEPIFDNHNAWESSGIKFGPSRVVNKQTFIVGESIVDPNWYMANIFVGFQA